MKNKIPENPTIVNLVHQAQDDYKKKLKEISKQEEQNRQKIASLTLSEKALKLKIEAGKKQIEKMADEYEELQREQAEANLSEIKKDEFSRKDVLNGKVSMAQFSAQGKTDEEIAALARDKGLENLEKVSDTIREKGAAITRLEVELYTIQNDIFGLTLIPVQLLRRSYKDLEDRLDFQIGGLTGDWSAAKSNLIQSRNELIICEQGRGLSAGYVWPNISFKQAKRLIHDPKLPKEHITLLLSQLADCEEGSRVTVTLRFEHSHWPGDPVEVREEL